MKRITFLVDGFNLYHSLKEAEQHLVGQSTRWINLHSLFSSYLHLYGKNSTLEDIFYFSALAEHMDKIKAGVTDRHNKYIECLKDTGVKDVMGRFKQKYIRCKSCNTSSQHHEEKETDVAISVMLMELFKLNKCDMAVLVSGDTDLAPAIRTALRLFPDKEVAMLFPSHTVFLT